MHYSQKEEYLAFLLAGFNYLCKICFPPTVSNERKCFKLSPAPKLLCQKCLSAENNDIATRGN